MYDSLSDRTAPDARLVDDGREHRAEGEHVSAAGARRVSSSPARSRSAIRTQFIVRGLMAVAFVTLTLAIAAARLVESVSPFVIAVSVSAVGGLIGGIAAGPHVQRVDARRRCEVKMTNRRSESRGGDSA